MDEPVKLAAGWLATFAARTAPLSEDDTWDTGVRSLAALILREREAAFDAGERAGRAGGDTQPARRKAIEGRPARESGRANSP